MSDDNTNYDEAKLAALRESLEQGDAPTVTVESLRYCLSVIEYLKDENDSLWFMLEEQKNSKWTSEHSAELEKTIQQQLDMLKLMQMGKGEA